MAGPDDTQQAEQGLPDDPSLINEVTVDPKTGNIIVGGQKPVDDEQEDDAPAGMDTAEETARVNNREYRRNKNARRRSASAYKDAVIRGQSEQIRELQQRLAGMEGRLSSHDLYAVDNRIGTVQGMIARAQSDMAEAIERSDGKEAAKSQTLITELQGQLTELQNIRGQVENVRKAGAKFTEPKNEIEPEAIQLAERWAAQNPWYNPKGTDTDSALVRSIDRKLYEEGYDPTDPTYWKELSRRVAATVGQRHNRSDDAGEDDMEDIDFSVRRGGNGANPGNGSRSGPPVGGRSGGARNDSREFVLSRERVQAMKDSGAWDDPEKRKRVIQRYMDYDRKRAAGDAA